MDPVVFTAVLLRLVLDASNGTIISNEVAAPYAVEQDCEDFARTTIPKVNPATSTIVMYVCASIVDEPKHPLHYDGGMGLTK